MENKNSTKRGIQFAYDFLNKSNVYVSYSISTSLASYPSCCWLVNAVNFHEHSQTSIQRTLVRKILSVSFRIIRAMIEPKQATKLALSCQREGSFLKFLRSVVSEANIFLPSGKSKQT